VTKKDRTVEPDDQGFLKRWSRLKQEEAGAQPEAASPEVVPEEKVEANALTETGAAAEADEEAPFDPADLPDIDSLTKESDFTGFLKEGVPEKLRHMALQKLWRSDPALAVLDGLNDYDEDFSMVGKVAEKIVSGYKPGRGYADDEDETEEDGTETAGMEDSDIEDEDSDIEDSELDDTELADAQEMKPGEKT